MRLARIEGKSGRFVASPDLRCIPAFCPVCDGSVLPKCGSIRIHHWAHRVAECDPWWEPETEWHRQWKERFPEECQEVPVGPHRADIKTGRLVIELQHSPISPEAIRDREAFYGDMIWIFDARDLASINLEHRPPGSQPGGWLFWSPERKSLLSCTKPVFLDLGGDQIVNLYDYGSHRHPDFGLSWRFGHFDSFPPSAVVDHALQIERRDLPARPLVTADFDKRPWPPSVLESPSFLRATARHHAEERRKEQRARFEAERDYVSIPDPQKPGIQIENGRATLNKAAMDLALSLAREELTTTVGLGLLCDGPVALFIFRTEPTGHADEAEATAVYTVGQQTVTQAKRSELHTVRLSGRGVLYPTHAGVRVIVRMNGGLPFERLFAIA